MGPPVWAKLATITGDDKYIDFMMSEFKATTDHLWDPESNLYFRDYSYINKIEHGRKVFWGRGKRLGVWWD